MGQKHLRQRQKVPPVPNDNQHRRLDNGLPRRCHPRLLPLQRHPTLVDQHGHGHPRRYLIGHRATQWYRIEGAKDQKARKSDLTSHVENNLGTGYLLNYCDDCVALWWSCYVRY